MLNHELPTSRSLESNRCFPLITHIQLRFAIRIQQEQNQNNPKHEMDKKPQGNISLHVKPNPLPNCSNRNKTNMVTHIGESRAQFAMHLKLKTIRRGRSIRQSSILSRVYDAPANRAGKVQIYDALLSVIKS